MRTLCIQHVLMPDVPKTLFAKTREATPRKITGRLTITIGMRPSTVMNDIIVAPCAHTAHCSWTPGEQIVMINGWNGSPWPVCAVRLGQFVLSLKVFGASLKGLCAASAAMLADEVACWASPPVLRVDFDWFSLVLPSNQSLSDCFQPCRSPLSLVVTAVVPTQPSAQLGTISKTLYLHLFLEL